MAKALHHPGRGRGEHTQISNSNGNSTLWKLVFSISWLLGARRFHQQQQQQHGMWRAHARPWYRQRERFSPLIWFDWIRLSAINSRSGDGVSLFTARNEMKWSVGQRWWVEESRKRCVVVERPREMEGGMGNEWETYDCNADEMEFLNETLKTRKDKDKATEKKLKIRAEVC